MHETDDVVHLTNEELRTGLDPVRQSPADRGVLELIVRRPEVDGREVVDTGELHVEDGLVGDTWQRRGSRHTDDGSAERGRQLTIMNARAIDLFASGDRARWPLAGDQLFVDLDLSRDNLPAGTRLVLGTAVLEVSDLPHTGCAKFAERFGMDAARFVNSDDGKALRLRGINASVVQAGTVRAGDVVTKVPVSGDAAG